MSLWPHVQEGIFKNNQKYIIFFTFPIVHVIVLICANLSNVALSWYWLISKARFQTSSEEVKYRIRHYIRHLCFLKMVENIILRFIYEVETSCTLILFLTFITVDYNFTQVARLQHYIIYSNHIIIIII